MKSKLLSRDDFRNAVFARDQHRCVFCKRTGEETPEGKLDAHHILERRLFQAPEEKGGYFLDNGSTVCEEHHMECERTTISVPAVREACGILKPVVPSHLYDEFEYDKWGNIVLATGMRLKGELFYDESVQKVLGQGGVLEKFFKYVKHPRLYHLPWSESLTDDDRMLQSLAGFDGREVIVTEKADGEQTTIYNDYLHARSIDGPSHASRNLVKSFAAQWQYNLGDEQRICGENVYAAHSIAYDANNPAPHHFLGFSMWEGMTCLGWDETMENFEILGVTPVRTMWRGIFDEQAIRALYDTKRDWDTVEGYVVRLVDSFTYGQFRNSVAKFVRAGHVQTAKHHWRSQKIIPNTFFLETK